MKKYDLHNIKSIIKYIIYVTSVMTACYGFWGCLFPDLTLVGGTYCIVSEDAQISGADTDGTERYSADVSSGTVKDAEVLYADILEGRVTVRYRSRLWEIIKSKCGLEND